jgi:hypothetical protein
MSETELLIACRTALGYSKRGLAQFIGHREYRMVRRWESGEQDIPVLLWIALFYMLRDNGKRVLMNQVHSVIQQRRLG